MIGKCKVAFRTMALMGALIGASLSSAQSQTEFDRHIEASRLNTGGDPAMVNSWRAFYCNLADNNTKVILDQRATASIRVPLTQLFDDVWYLGSEYVGQYILKNDQGFVLIDTTNSTAEEQTYAVPALMSLGLNASLPLNTILLTHGHADHDGGAQYLKQTFNPDIYLGSGDIDLGGHKTYAPILWDSSIRTPYDVTVGGRTVTVLSTPGHTAGTTSYIITAHDKGKPIKLYVSGGANYQSDAATRAQYVDSTERIYALLKAQKVDSASNPHTQWDGSLQLVKQIEADGLQSPSQFIIGNTRLLRGVAITHECAAATLAQVDPSAVTAVWRVSQLEFMPASPAPNRVAVRLSNGWGPLANQQVSFTVQGSGATCSATSDANGVATCSSPLGTLTSGVDQVTASFAGMTGSGTVDLGSEVSATVDNGCGDLNAAKAAVGARRGDAKYVARLDFDGNGVIDIRDIAATARLVPAGTVCNR